MNKRVIYGGLGTAFTAILVAGIGLYQLQIFDHESTPVLPLEPATDKVNDQSVATAQPAVRPTKKEQKTATVDLSKQKTSGTDAWAGISRRHG